MNLTMRTAEDQLRELAGCLEKVRWNGPNRITACCVAHRDRSPSMTVSIGSNGKLLWKCFAGCSQDAVGHILRSMLGGTFFNAPKTASEWHTNLRRDTNPFIKRCIEEIWNDTRAIERGDVVDRYLTGRGIRLERFPADVRCHPKLAYYADRRGPGEKAKVVGYYPAMVCAMRDAQGKIQALHRTYLSSRGIKITDALPDHPTITKARKVIGTTEGLVIRLGDAGETLVVGEGIETCMAAGILAGHPAWSAYSASNLPNVVIPDSVKRVIIASDNDAAGRMAAAKLASRLINNKLVNVTAQFADGRGNDWADVIKEVTT